MSASGEITTTFQSYPYSIRKDNNPKYENTWYVFSGEHHVINSFDCEKDALEFIKKILSDELQRVDLYLKWINHLHQPSQSH